MTRTGRTLARLGGPVLLAVAVLGGCAQPGQLGSPVPAPAPAAPVPAASPAVPAAPVAAEIGTGTLQNRITLRTLGTAQVTVRTVVLAPGETTGWHRHPGTETAIVNAGQVTVRQADQCSPQRYGPGQAVFVADAQPHEMRNDGAEPAQLVITWILAPDAPDRVAVDPGCSAAR